MYASPFFLRPYFFGALLRHSKIKLQVERFPLCPLPTQMPNLPHYQHPPPKWYMCYNR